MPQMEQIIRPFLEQEVGPTPYAPTSGQDDKPAIVKIGLKGGTKTFTGDFTYQLSTKIGAVHAEVGHGSSACCDSTVIQNALHSVLPGAP